MARIAAWFRFAASCIAADRSDAPVVFMRSHHRLRQRKKVWEKMQTWTRKLCRSRWLRQQYEPPNDTQHRRHGHRRHRSPACGRSTQRPALIRKADHFAATGDSRSASAFYLAALRAAPPSAKVPPELLRELRRAQETCAVTPRTTRITCARGWRQHGFDATPFERAVRAVAGHHLRRASRSTAGAPLLLFPRTAERPVLRARAVPVDGRRRGRDRRDPGGVARGHAHSRRVLALRDRPREPATQGRTGHAQQSGLERLLPLEERRARPREPRALPERHAGAAQRAARDRRRTVRRPSCSRCSSRARTFRPTTGWSIPG